MTLRATIANENGYTLVCSLREAANAKGRAKSGATSLYLSMTWVSPGTIVCRSHSGDPCTGVSLGKHVEEILCIVGTLLADLFALTVKRYADQIGSDRIRSDRLQARR